MSIFFWLFLVKFTRGCMCTLWFTVLTVQRHYFSWKTCRHLCVDRIGETCISSLTYEAAVAIDSTVHTMTALVLRSFPHIVNTLCYYCPLRKYALVGSRLTTDTWHKTSRSAAEVPNLFLFCGWYIIITMTSQKCLISVHTRVKIHPQLAS